MTPNQGKLARPAVFRVTALALSVLLVLGFAEVFFWLFWSEPWYERLPEQQIQRSQSAFEVGGREFVIRHPPLGLSKLPDTRRILFVGDSFTYGSGVREVDTFVSLITAKLNEESQRNGGPLYESFNAGIPASMTSDWIHLFDSVAEGFEPDWVVVVFFLRDGVEGVTSLGQITRIRNEMAKLSGDSPLYRYSRLWRYFVDRDAQARLSDEYLGRLRNGYIGNEQQTREWRRAQANLQYLEAEAARLGARFALVIFPVLFELREDYPLEAAVDEILRFGNGERMKTLSLLPAFRGRSAPELWVSPLDQHPNAEGHTIAAQAVFEMLSASEHSGD